METFRTIIGCLPCSFEDGGKGNLVYAHQADHSDGFIEKGTSRLRYTTESQPSSTNHLGRSQNHDSEPSDCKSFPFLDVSTAQSKFNVSRAAQHRKLVMPWRAPGRDWSIEAPRCHDAGV